MAASRLYIYFTALLTVSLVQCGKLDDIEYDLSDGTQKVGSKSNLGVDMVTSAGLHFEFPYYKDTRTLDSALKEHFDQFYDHLFSEIRAVIQKDLKDPPGILGLFRWIGHGKDFVYMIKDQEARRANIPVPSPVDHEYDQYTKDFFMRVLSRAELVEDSYGKRKPDKAKLIQDVDDFTMSMTEVVRKNPTAGFADWAQAKVSGESLENHMAHLFGRLRCHGFGTVFTVIKKIGNFF